MLCCLTTAPSPVAESGASGDSWVDLAENVAGRHVGAEANRRRATGPGAEGEHIVAEALASLTTISWSDRLRGRAPPWWVLHSIPVGTGSSDIDHLVGGPPGVFSINTKHHRTGRVEIGGEMVLVNRRPTEYVGKAQAEARRATRLLRTALGQAGLPDLAGRATVRPVLAIVGARLLGRGLPGGVLVATATTLALLMREQPTQLSRTELELLHQHARKSTTWTH